MGGRPLGDVASDFAMRAVVDAFCQRPTELVEASSERDLRRTEDEDRLVEALELANRRVHELAADLTGQAGDLGTTCVAALFARDGQSVTIANVGDSRCYRVRDGQAALLTSDHTLASALERHASWLDASAIAAPRHVLTRAIGLRPAVAVDVTTDYTADGDVYVICTDGLWSAVEQDVIADVATRCARGELSIDDGCEILVEKANLAGGADNITVVLAHVQLPVEVRHESGPGLRGPHGDFDDEPTADGFADLDWV
jgi:protein phosphatase